MFKSIFAKYISVFMLIILISFVALVGIITSAVNNYSVDSKTELIRDAAHSVADYFEDRLARTELVDFSSYILLNESDISAVMKVVADNSEDISILITDTNGNIIHFTDNAISEQIIHEHYMELFLPTETAWREKTVQDFKTAALGILNAKLR